MSVGVVGDAIAEIGSEARFVVSIEEVALCFATTGKAMKLLRDDESHDPKLAEESR